MQIAQLALFSTVMILTTFAGGFCLIFGSYGFYKLKTAQNTEVKVGSHFIIKTPFPGLVLCFFGLVLFLTVAWLADAKIQIAKLTTTVSQQSSQLAELRKDNEQLSASQKPSPSDDLKNVETGLIGVHSGLDATKDNLKMARSEMGTLIARNHDEIDLLRRLGEREYIEFTIEVGKAQKVGNFTVELRSADPKHNQFTIDVRTVNEPIFFYTSGNRLPKELVVNKVTNNSASGYLSVPKPDKSKPISPS
jgi:hypothetical protein